MMRNSGTGHRRSFSDLGDVDESCFVSIIGVTEQIRHGADDIKIIIEEGLVLAAPDCLY
ncbi:hypothetical protein D3C72_2119560 [compost metagenome]